jgi:hypothetical protein
MKKYIIIISIILILLLVWQQHLIRNSPKEDNLLEKIESLNKKLDSINIKKDSVRNVIDSTHIKIITNEKHYQERVNTIITQPDSFSESFTRQYLRNYASTRGYRIVGTPETE